MRGNVRIDSALTLRGASGLAASERWLELLAQLEEQGSIVAAAKAVGLSYKAAWDAIETMNNLADEPLVQRLVGGRGGGSSRLTAVGKQLIRTFRLAQRRHGQFLRDLNHELGDAAPQLRVLGRLGMRTSARNQFAGTVSRIQRGAVNDEIEIALRGDRHIVAIITRASTEDLGLVRGAAVVAWVKASWIILAVQDEVPQRLSARNQLPGQIARLRRGAVNTEVVIDIGEGQTVAATVTNVSARELKLKRGVSVTAVFKASSVILAVAE